MRTIRISPDVKKKFVNVHSILAKKPKKIDNCIKKIAYKTKDDAVNIAKNNPPHRRLYPLYVYLCPYHLTKKTP